MKKVLLLSQNLQNAFLQAVKEGLQLMRKRDIQRAMYHQRRWQSKPERNFEHLSKQSYWKSRYYKACINNDSPFDWFLASSELIDALDLQMKEVHAKCVLQGLFSSSNPKLKYLELGCGTSDVPYNLTTSSQTPHTMILLDFAMEALQFQHQRLSKVKTQHDFLTLCADATRLPFCDDSLHLAVDKGTMDSVLKDKQRGHQLSRQILAEIKRVLKPGCRYVQISDEDPDSRLLFLERIWSGKSREDNPLTKLSECMDHTYNMSKEDISCSEQTKNGSQTKEGGLNSSSESDADIVLKIKKNSSQTDLDAVIENSWSFTSINSDLEQEYFMYWIDK